MASFAVATALTQEMRQRDMPRQHVLLPLLYVGAGIPAVARMYVDEHWTSDIVMGAFLGVFAGQKSFRTVIFILTIASIARSSARG